MNESDRHIEKELFRLIASGDAHAFRAVYDQYQRKVYFIAWRLLHSEADAEDVVQEVFSRIWRGRNSIERIENFNAYLNTLVRNHIFNRLRKKAHENAFLVKSTRDIESQNDNINAGLEFKDLETQLHQAMKSLPPQQRKVFQLGRLDGWKHEEIALEMGISRETVKKHMMAAVRTIRSLLNSKGKMALLLIFILEK